MRQLNAHIWIEDQIVTMPGGIPFPARSTVVRLANGDVWVHAPLKPTPQWIEAIAKIGEVRHIVAPNTFHHLFVKKFAAQHPDATCYAPRGLQKKRSDIDGLNDLNEELWPEDFKVRRIQGADKLDESVFLHHPTRTLIVTDAMFHFTSFPHWKTRLITWMANAAPGPRISRLLRFVMTDKAAFIDALGAMLEWDFDCIVMAHGDVIVSGGKDKLRQAIKHRFGMVF